MFIRKSINSESAINTDFVKKVIIINLAGSYQIHFLNENNEICDHWDYSNKEKRDERWFELVNINLASQI